LGKFNKVVPETCHVQYGINNSLEYDTSFVTANGHTDYSTRLDRLILATLYRFRIRCVNTNFVPDGKNGTLMSFRTNDDSK